MKTRLPPIPNVALEIAEAAWEGPIAMAVVDHDGLVLEINEAFNDKLGYGVQALKGKHFREFTLPSDAADDESDFKRLLEGEIDSYTMTKTWITKRGLQFTGRMYVSLTQHGEVVFAIAQITETQSPQQVALIAEIAHSQVREQLKKQRQQFETHIEPDDTLTAASPYRMVYNICRDQPWLLPVLAWAAYQLLKLYFEPAVSS
ncbi:MAG: PAS domain S-box protein [Planctomycetota bacterium]